MGDLMDYQDIKTLSIKLNKNQNIGRVIYIVEGERTELNILNHIFTKIFDYTYVEVKRQKNAENIMPIAKYVSKTQKSSMVFVINTQNSNISSIKNGRDYLDAIFLLLFEKYNLDPTKAAIYYIFDRDRGSNKDNIIRELLSKLHNSMDNQEESNGLLLLSYPKIEAFVISCFCKNCHLLKLKSHELDSYIDNNKYQQDLIYSDQLINACNEMIKSIGELINYKLKPFDIDNFGDINLNIYNKQEEYYNQHKYLYRILSLLIVSLIDLKLITIE